MFYRLDISKSKSILNWEPSVKLLTGLTEVKDWISNSFNQLAGMPWDYKG